MKKILLTVFLSFLLSVISSTAQPLNNWLEFDGIDDYVSLGNSSTLKPTSALTIELWAYHADWANSNDSRLISNTSGGGYNIQIEEGIISCFVELNDDYQEIQVLSSTLTEGWHHFAFTCDGRYTKFYIDGELKGTLDAGGNYSLTYDSNNCTLLGAEVGGGCDVKGDYLNGAIDEVRIWNVARTQQQIQDNMNLEVSSSSTGLACYWKLNETSGDLAVDEKGNNHGTLYHMSDGDWVSIMEESSISFTNVEYSSQDWGDYDNDDDLDFIISGHDGTSAITKIYNNENGNFTETGFSLEGVQYSSVKWGDINNDNYLDVILCGYSSSGNVTKIYKNNYGTSFSELPVSLENVRYGSVDLGDFNNDGFLDILLTGESSSSYTAIIYKNNGDETFTELPVSLTAVKYSSVSWGDYNNDTYLDLLLTGDTKSGYISKIYKNNGDETFSETAVTLTVVAYGSADWGDYDSDGDLDVLLTGDTGSGRILKLYENNGSTSDWSFTEKNIGTTTGVFYSSADWGDYNNDGYLDFIATGYTGASYSTKLYQNNLDGTFNQVSTISIADISAGDVKWGDYDNDGDLDLLISGDMSGTRITKLYKNNCLSSN
ncbi:MAG: FG-GAP-like repeat-containing protein, partial [Ignavibacteria bacterium]